MHRLAKISPEQILEASPGIDKIPRLSPEEIYKWEMAGRTQFEEITRRFNLEALKKAIEKYSTYACTSLVPIAQGKYASVSSI